MFKCIGVLFFLFPVLGLAAETARFECNEGPDSPTYQLSRVDADTFVMRAYFPGPDGLTVPIYSGDITAWDIKAVSCPKEKVGNENADVILNRVIDFKRLQAKTELLEKMGSTYEIQFPAQQCIRKNLEEGLYYIHCYTKSPVVINGVKLNNGISFHASGKKVTSVTMENKQYVPIIDSQVTVGVEIGVPNKNGTQYIDLPKTFSGDGCKVNSEFWNP